MLRGVLFGHCEEDVEARNAQTLDDERRHPGVGADRASRARLPRSSCRSRSSRAPSATARPALALGRRERPHLLEASGKRFDLRLDQGAHVALFRSLRPAGSWAGRTPGARAASTPIGASAASRGEDGHGDDVAVSVVDDRSPVWRAAVERIAKSDGFLAGRGLLLIPGAPTATCARRWGSSVHHLPPPEPRSWPRSTSPARSTDCAPLVGVTLASPGVRGARPAARARCRLPPACWRAPQLGEVLLTIFCMAAWAPAARSRGATSQVKAVDSPVRARTSRGSVATRRVSGSVARPPSSAAFFRSAHARITAALATASRLGGTRRRGGWTNGSRGRGIAAVQRQRGERAASQVRRPDAIAGEAECSPRRKRTQDPTTAGGCRGRRGSGPPRRADPAPFSAGESGQIGVHRS